LPIFKRKKRFPPSWGKKKRRIRELKLRLRVSGEKNSDGKSRGGKYPHVSRKKTRAPLERKGGEFRFFRKGPKWFKKGKKKKNAISLTPKGGGGGLLKTPCPAFDNSAKRVLLPQFLGKASSRKE